MGVGDIYQPKPLDLGVVIGIGDVSSSGPMVRRTGVVPTKRNFRAKRGHNLHKALVKK